MTLFLQRKIPKMSNFFLYINNFSLMTISEKVQNISQNKINTELWTKHFFAITTKKENI